MIDVNFTLVSGTYVDEQDLLGELDYFLTMTIHGWTKVKTITDTPTDRNIAYYTDGSITGIYDRMWVRARAVSNQLQFTVMSEFVSSTDTDIDPFGGTQSSTELPVGTTSGTYWFMANKDAVHIVVDRDDGATRHGGFGHFVTYYNRFEDPKPFYVFGQTAASQTFVSATRLRAYAPHSWGTSFDVLGSGTALGYLARHTSLLANGTPNPRSGEPKIIEPVFYTDSTFMFNEVRGEVPGLFMGGGTGYDHGNLVSIFNTPGTVSGTYFCHKHTDSLTWFVGPVTVSGEGGC